MPFPIAAPLHAPLDLIMARRIGALGHGELAPGAVVNGDDAQTVVNPWVRRRLARQRSR